MDQKQEIRALLQAFQDGYTHRDINQVDAFMTLFCVDAEVIGTNGVKPGVDEWYLSRAASRELVEGDWESWGDLRVNIEEASIHAQGNVGWIAASTTVTKRIGPENYASYLEFVKEFIDKSQMAPEQKLEFILRGGTNTVFEIRRGDNFVWPLRLTAVVVKEPDGWKFAQVNFSFPTVYFPDVRIMEDN